MNNYLLDAVDSLTKPIRTKVVQDVPADAIKGATKTVTVELPALLTQLDNSIRGTIGIGGSGSLAHQRNMLDADALFRFMRISSVIKDWARIAKGRVTPDAADTLRAWYTAYAAAQHSEDSDRFYIRQMDKWRAEIEAKLQPADVMLQPGACPTCGAETWWSKSTHEEYKFPLIVEYRKSGGPNLIQEARAMCRACEQVWGVRELAYLLEHAAEESG